MAKVPSGVHRPGDLSDTEADFLELYRDRIVQHQRATDQALARVLDVDEAYVAEIRTSICSKLRVPTLWRAITAYYGSDWRGTPATGSWRLDPRWVALLAAHGYACAYCGSRDGELTRDHMVPISAGGSIAWENIVPACNSCNASKAQLGADEFRRRRESREWQAMKLLRQGLTLDEVYRRLNDPSVSQNPAANVSQNIVT